MILGRMLMTLAIGALATPASSAFAAHCPRQAPNDIADAVRAMYAAAAKGDDAALHDQLAPDFYAFEGGVRMDGMTLPNTVRKAQNGGRRFQWSVTKPDVRMQCGLATIAYVNVGAVGDSSGMRPVTWLESATLIFARGAWRIAFLNSTRTPAQPQ